MCVCVCIYIFFTPDIFCAVKHRRQRRIAAAAAAAAASAAASGGQRRRISFKLSAERALADRRVTSVGARVTSY